MDKMTNEQIKKLHESRAAMYRLLSSLFEKEPDTALLEKMKTITKASMGDDELFGSEYSQIYDYISRTDIDVTEELAVDFARAFLGVGSRQTGGAFPYESVYTSREGAMMQKAMDEVIEVYALNGFVVVPSAQQPADHIHIEFEFVARLAEKAAHGSDKSLEENLRIHDEFLREHIINWVPRFCSDLRRFALTPYYLAIANITEGFIKLDAEMLTEV